MATKASFLKNLPSSVRISKRGRVRIPKPIQLAIRADHSGKRYHGACQNIEDYYTTLALHGLAILRSNSALVINFLPDVNSRSAYKQKRNAPFCFNYAAFTVNDLTFLSGFSNIGDIEDVRDAISVCVLIGQANVNGGLTCAPLSIPRVSSSAR